MGLRRPELALSSGVRRVRGPQGIWGTAPTSQAFSPLSLAPALWLKADAGAYTDAGKTTLATDTDPVRVLADWSGNGRDVTQGTSSKRPTWVANVLNGYPALRFDGTDDMMLFAAGVTPAAVMSVFRRTATGIKSTPFGHNSGVTLELPTWYTDNVLYYDFGGNEKDAGAADTRTGAFLSVVTNNGSSSVARINGAAQTLSGSLSGSLAVDGIGFSSTIHFHNGDLLELLGLPAVPDAAQISQIETYLNTKYAIY